MSKKIRLSEYLNKLNESEVENSKNPSQQKIELTSPHSAMSDEELRVFLPYMHGRNAFLVTEKIPERKKNLMLRIFLRSKRNQYVEVKQKYEKNKIEFQKENTGKVTAVGRDFVMLTTVRKKRWLPFTYIESANVLSGFPDYTNSYSQVYYDNDLKKKLRTQFATTVASKDELIQQFYEETLFTNLKKWRGTNVLIATVQNDFLYGKLSSISENSLTITSLTFKNEIPLSSIVMMETVSPMKTLFYVIKNIRNRRSINS
jgi:ribosome maturation factor RimP